MGSQLFTMNMAGRTKFKLFLCAATLFITSDACVPQPIFQPPTTTPTTTTPTPTTPTTTTTTPTTTTTTPTSLEIASDCRCGILQRRARIIGGKEAEPNEYPWMAGLFHINSYSGDKAICGGSLINAGWILSAAHCFQERDGTEDPKDWHASLGDHDYLTDEDADHVDVNISRILNHPKFVHNGKFHFDFSLLKLSERIDFSIHPHIRPICLPLNDEKTYENDLAVVTGWGTTVSGFDVLSNVLLELNVNVISNEACKNDYGYTSNQITDEMLCANVIGGGKDACQSDSGGPLIGQCRDTVSRRYELIGVVSWGLYCAWKQYPGVYARVSKQLDWIKKNSQDGSKECARESFARSMKL